MEKNKSNIKCCEMYRDTATCICYQCFMYFCDSCYKIIHDKKQNNQHKKEKIDYFVPIDTKCPLHPKDRINLFCLDEKGMKYINFLIFKSNLF